MLDLLPFVVGTAVTDLALLGVFAELYRREGGRHLALWACAYALDAGRHGLTIVANVVGESAPLEITSLALLVAGAIVLLAGTARFAGRSLHAAWYGAAALALIATVAFELADATHMLRTLPAAGMLTAARILSGIELLRARDLSRWPRALAGVPLILHGLHAANYPFVRPIPALAPWGFLVSTILATVVAIGILLIHSERARVEAQASARRYQELFDGSIEGLFRTSTRGRFLSANPALVKMLGYEHEEEVLALDLVRDVYANAADRGRILAHQDGDTDTVELRRKDGSTIQASVHGRRHRDEGGNVLWFEGSMRDVTTEIRLREELARAQRMEALGRMAGGIAHDFNNVLATIVAATELASLRAARAQPIAAELEDVKGAALRASELTRQLLAFGRTQVLARTPHDLGLIVRESSRVLARVISEEIALSVHIDGDAERDPIVVLADAGQIEQVVLNLALNARDAMPRGGHLRIALERTELDRAPFARITVEDDGAGMDEETRLRMFEPFFTTKTRGSGTGLGLSSVYGIVAQIDGRIDVDSSVGRGTRVAVFLPIAVGATIPAEPRDPAAHPDVAPALRVLLVEDDAPLRELTERALRERGHDVEVARSAEEALAAFDARPGAFDLVVSDVVMTGASGTDLARDLRARRQHLPIVLVSGHAADRNEEIARMRVQFLSKPYTSDQLFEAVALGCRDVPRG